MQSTYLKNSFSEFRIDKHNTTLPPYEEVDAILYRLLERWQSRDEIIEAGFEEATVDMVRRLMYGALNHIYQFCPIVELSSMPLDKSYVDLPRGGQQ